MLDKIFIVALVSLFAVVSAEEPYLHNQCEAEPFKSYPFCDAALDIESRVSDALSRLNVTTKLACLSTEWPALPSLGVPTYNWWSEATHGASHVRFDAKTPFATSFAFPITTAMSFNRSLWRATGAAISMEATTMMRLGNAYSTFWVSVLIDPSSPFHFQLYVPNAGNPNLRISI